MIKHIKQYLVHYLCGLFVTLSLLFSTLSTGQDQETVSKLNSFQSDANSPPIAQTLVPEGILATQLAEALKLGALQDEPKSEDLLSHLGIEPKNGWLAEYPVTPEVLGDIEKDMTVASEEGKIALTKEQALKLFNDVKTKLGFNVNLDSVVQPEADKKAGITKIYSYTDDKGTINFTDDFKSIPQEYQKSAKLVSQSMPHESSNELKVGETDEIASQSLVNPNPQVINNYYYEQGPPLVTYYSPPDPYYYLYSWVPYPFWSSGFYFTGFYVLNNFRRQMFFNNKPYFLVHHAGSGSFSHPLSVGPFNRASPGHIVTESQERYRWFSAPNAQAGARAIVMLNQNRTHFNNNTGVNMPQLNPLRSSVSSVGNFKTTNNAGADLNNRIIRQSNSVRNLPHFGGRILNQPAFNQRSFVLINPRFYTSPAITSGSTFNSVPRSVNGNFAHEFHNNVGAPVFHGGGGFSGGSRGGHR